MKFSRMSVPFFLLLVISCNPENHQSQVKVNQTEELKESSIPFFSIEKGYLIVAEKRVESENKIYELDSQDEPVTIDHSALLNRIDQNRIETIDGEVIVISDLAVGFLAHYYHFMENLIGIWNFLVHDSASEVKRVYLSLANEPLGENSWRGMNDVNYHLLRSLFPNAEFSSLDTVPKDKVIYAKKIHISSRNRSFGIADIGGLNMNGSTRKFFKAERLRNLRDIVFEKLGVISYTDKTGPRITYVPRLNASRPVDPRLERSVIKTIQSASNRSLMEVDFSKINFKDQLQLIANTDILVGAHGNGLTHLLFLPDDAAVIEFQSDPSSFFQLFAEARGVGYFGNMKDKWLIGKVDKLENQSQFSVERVDLAGLQNIVKSLTFKWQRNQKITQQ